LAIRLLALHVPNNYKEEKKRKKKQKKNEEHQQYAPQADQVVDNLTLGPPARGPNPAGPTFWNAFAKSGLEKPR
jgi:hypothetical protein